MRKFKCWVLKLENGTYERDNENTKIPWMFDTKKQAKEFVGEPIQIIVTIREVPNAK